MYIFIFKKDKRSAEIDNHEDKCYNLCKWLIFLYNFQKINVLKIFMLYLNKMCKLQGYNQLKHALIPIQEKKAGSGFKRN